MERFDIPPPDAPAADTGACGTGLTLR